jgi:hypothetical protein
MELSDLIGELRSDQSSLCSCRKLRLAEVGAHSCDDPEHIANPEHITLRERAMLDAHSVDESAVAAVKIPNRINGTLSVHLGVAPRNASGFDTQSGVLSSPEQETFLCEYLERRERFAH